MKRTLRKIAAVIRRSPVTKFIVTSLLTTAGLLAFFVLAGEPTDELSSFEEVAKLKLYAAAILGVDILMFKIAYKLRLLPRDLYEKEEA